MAATTNLATNKTLAASVSPSAIIASALSGGKVRARFDSFTSTAQIDSGSTIETLGFKKGEVPIGILVVTAGLGAAVTLKVGDGTTADLFVATGGITSLQNASMQIKLFPAAVFGAALTADKRVVLTTEAANFATDKTLKVALLYSNGD